MHHSFALFQRLPHRHARDGLRFQPDGANANHPTVACLIARAGHGSACLVGVASRQPLVLSIEVHNLCVDGRTALGPTMSATDSASKRA
jgi:hypothetical protein